MTKLSVDQALSRAMAFEKKGQLEQAHALYTKVLDAFPKNARAQRALAAMENATGKPKAATSPSKEQLDALVALYNKRQLSEVIEEAQRLLLEYPSALELWNIKAAALQGQGRLDDAIKSYRSQAISKGCDQVGRPGLRIISQDQLFTRHARPS